MNNEQLKNTLKVHKMAFDQMQAQIFEFTRRRDEFVKTMIGISSGIVGIAIPLIIGKEGCVSHYETFLIGMIILSFLLTISISLYSWGFALKLDEKGIGLYVEQVEIINRNGYEDEKSQNIQKEGEVLKKDYEAEVTSKAHGLDLLNTISLWGFFLGIMFLSILLFLRLSW